MNAIELFHQDGKSASVYYCEKCRSVGLSKESTERCCRPYLCNVCGIECGRSWLVCETCREEKRTAVERKRFDAAEKVTHWDGPVFCDGVGTDGYFPNLDELIEFEIENNEDGDVLPAYAWTCNEIPIVSLDYGTIIENATQDAHENFDPLFDLSGTEELEKALEAFNQINARKVNWEPNFKKAVIIVSRSWK